MAEPSPLSSGSLTRYREYLVLLARVQIDPRLRVKVDPEQVVRAALVRAGVVDGAGLPDIRTAVMPAVAMAAPMAATSMLFFRPCDSEAGCCNDVLPLCLKVTIAGHPSAGM